MFQKNKHISQQDKDFLTLLNAGLWQKSESKLSDKPDWEYIYTLANQQAVIGIVADGINIQNQSDNIPQDIQFKFLVDTASITKRNHQLNELQSKICNQLNKNNIKYAIIKGQAVAQSYPNPNLRACGDIDILLPEEDLKRAKQLLIPQATQLLDEESNNIHFGMLFNDIEVELHSNDCSHEEPHLDSTISNECIRMFETNRIYTYTSNNTGIAIPDYTYHAFFLFYHILRHASDSKIGLRQICDWIIFCCHNHNKIDNNHLQDLIRQSRITNLWNRYAKFCREYLNCPQNLSTGKYNKNIDWLWTLFKYSGNMGEQRPEYKSVTNSKMSKPRRILCLLEEIYDRYQVERKYSAIMALNNLIDTINIKLTKLLYR